MSLAEKIERVLANDRIEKRFRLFETVTLPSLDAQDDRDFRLLVAASTLLNETWKARLSELAAARPYLDVQYYAPTNFRVAQTADDVRVLLDPGRPFYTFRLDDDDALSSDFMSRVRPYLKEEFAGHAISFCRGYYLELDGSDCRITEKIHTNASMGIGLIASPMAPRTIFEHSEHHKRAHERVPVITDARKPAFVAVTHGDNDTGQSRSVIGDNISGAEAEATLRRLGFNLRLDALTSGRPLPPVPTELSEAEMADLIIGRASLRAPSREEIKTTASAFRTGGAAFVEKRADLIVEVANLTRQAKRLTRERNRANRKYRKLRDRLRFWHPANWRFYARAALNRLSNLTGGR